MIFTTLALGVVAFVAVIAIVTVIRRMASMSEYGTSSARTEHAGGDWSPHVYSSDSTGDAGGDCSSDSGGSDGGGGDCGSGGDGGGGGGSD